MADISKITLPSGSVYNIKDAAAREAIAELQSYTDYLGVTTTALTDGATTNPITINNVSVTAKKGNIVNYGSKEFIFNGTAWQLFGDMSGLGALAYKNSVWASYTPCGSVAQPTFTGTAATIKTKITAAGSVAISVGTGTANYTPAGSVSQPTFSGTQGSVSVSGTPTGSVAISKGTGTANYTPEGTVSQPTFTGTQGSVSVSGTAKGSVAISTGSGTANYTPAGSVSAPTITVTPSTATVNSITNVGSLPSLSCTVENENLTIAFNQGTLPTKGSNQTVVTGISSAAASQPTFTGTGVELKATFTGQANTSTGNFTPSGSVSQPTFTGTGAQLKASFTGNALTSTGNFTPSGTVSQPTFSGTAVQLKGTFTGSEVEGSASYTPAGTVSKPGFTGTAATITAS